MLILMELWWLWVVMGVVCVIWGNGVLGFRWRDWVEFWLTFSLSFFSEDTAKEKKRLKQQRVEEELVANPGCLMILVGVGLIVYGVVRGVSG